MQESFVQGKLLVQVADIFAKAMTSDHHILDSQIAVWFTSINLRGVWNGGYAEHHTWEEILFSSYIGIIIINMLDWSLGIGVSIKIATPKSRAKIRKHLSI